MFGFNFLFLAASRSRRESGDSDDLLGKVVKVVVKELRRCDDWSRAAERFQSLSERIRTMGSWLSVDRAGSWVNLFDYLIAGRLSLILDCRWRLLGTGKEHVETVVFKVLLAQTPLDSKLERTQVGFGTQKSSIILEKLPIAHSNPSSQKRRILRFQFKFKCVWKSLTEVCSALV